MHVLSGPRNVSGWASFTAPIAADLMQCTLLEGGSGPLGARGAGGGILLAGVITSASSRPALPFTKHHEVWIATLFART